MKNTQNNFERRKTLIGFLSKPTSQTISHHVMGKYSKFSKKRKFQEKNYVEIFLRDITYRQIKHTIGY